MSGTALNLTDLQHQLDLLNQDTEEEWTLLAGKLHKTFAFKNFVEAFGFMTKAAIHAERINHHPEWSNVYRTVEINLITHDADGITELDFKLAKIMDRLV